MQLTRLSANQKRILDWQQFLSHGGCASAQLGTKIESAIKALQAVLTRCWQSKVITTEDENLVSDLERVLEALDEEARLSAGACTPIKKEATFVPRP